MKRQPHPFARFINILGRGKTLTRSLTIEEAEEAMAMILAGETLPEQLGAFLMLLRVKEESPAEIAGFVRAARATMQAPARAPHVDVDWSSYAGKGRQLPWFTLSALILARNGWRVFMHGAEAHTQGRIYTGAALRALAKLLGAPIVLVVDACGMARGVAPLVQGYAAFDRDAQIAGVILNKVGSERQTAKLRQALERYTDIPVLGAVGRDEGVVVRERHLGLTTPDETAESDAIIECARDAVARSVDLTRVREIAANAQAHPAALAPIVRPRAQDLRVAVARDEAFGRLPAPVWSEFRAHASLRSRDIRAGPAPMRRGRPRAARTAFAPRPSTGHRVARRCGPRPRRGGLRATASYLEPC